MAASHLPAMIQTWLSSFWRRRWLIIIVAWILSLIGWLVVAILPDRYDAMTRIYVDTETLLAPLLRNITVQTDLQRQLEVLQRTLLNRNNIVHVVHATDMDLDTRSEADKEALYERLAKQIKIKAEGTNLFTVTYTDSDPPLAKKVVETLLNLFVETNLGQNRTSIENARNFIENQIAEYEQKLKQADQRLADYKESHVNVLVATGANFSGRLDTARQEQVTAKSHYDEAVIARDQLRAHLATTPQYLDVETAPQVVITGNGQVTANSSKARVQQLQAELNQMLTRFTDQHPDVIAVKRALEQAQAAADSDSHPSAASGGGRNTARVSNPVYEQLTLRMAQADADVAQAQSRMQVSDQEMHRLEQLGSSAPQVEADLADLNREYGVIKQKYEELLARRESARISEAVETRGDKLQFRIVEAPQVPVRPSFPNRPLFVSGVLLAAIGIGIGIAFLMHKIDDTVSSLADLTEEFNIRVLGKVQKVENSARAMMRRRGLRTFSLASCSLFAVYLAVLTLTQFDHYPQFVAALHLPELLQRIRDYAG